MRRDQIPPLEDVVRAHARYVRGIARAVLGGDDAVEDVVQDTWLVAARTGPRKPGALRAWLAVVARNLSYRVRRGAARRSARERQAAHGEQGPDVAEIAALEEMRRRLVSALLALEEPYRAALLLRYFEDRSVPEVALRLAVPLETARTRLRRGLVRLRARLDEKRGGDHRAWAVALAPLAQGPRPSPGLVLLEGLVMKKTLAIVVALLLLGGLAWVTLGPSKPSEEAPAGAPVAARVTERLSGDAGLAARGARDTPAPASIPGPLARGRVVDAEGRAVPGARVRAWRDDLAKVIDPTEQDAGPVRSARTDEQGTFVVPLEGRAPGFTLMATAPGFAPAAMTGIRADDDVTLVVSKGDALHGTVRDLDGHPIPGARVAWTAFVGNARAAVETLTASDGSYHLEGLPSTPGLSDLPAESVAVTAEGYAPVRDSLARARSHAARVARSGDIAWDVWLGRGATVRGRIVDADTDEPVAQARVMLWSEANVTGLTLADGTPIQNPEYYAAVGDTVTSLDGTFTIGRVPAWGVHVPGQHTVSATVRRLGRVGVVAAGYAIETREMNVPTEGEVVEIELRVAPAGTVRGRVLLQDGRPAGGAFVGWRRPQTWPWTWIPPVFEGLTLPSDRSDEQGHYLLPLLPAPRRGAEPLEILAAPAGASPFTKRATLHVTPRAGETVEVADLVLGSAIPDGPSALVTVVDESGEPVWGATFEGCLPGSRTDESGHARLFFDQGFSAPREVTIVVHAPGRLPVRAPTMTVAAGTAPEIRAVLGPRRPPVPGPFATPAAAAPLAPDGFALEGTIRDARTDRPILKWEASMRGEGGERRTAFPVGPGRFRSEGLAPGTWTLEVRAEGYEPEFRKDLRVGPDGAADALEVRLVAGILLRGRVRDEGGVPIGGARVLFDGQGVPSLHGEAGPDGRFSVRGLRAGARYAVWVARDDGHGGMAFWVPKPFEDLPIAPEATTVERELTVGVAGSLALDVPCEALGTGATAPTGDEVAAGKATVLTFTDSARSTVWRTVGVWQRQRSVVLPVGRWSVRVEVPGMPSREVEVVVEAGKNAQATIQIP